MVSTSCPLSLATLPQIRTATSPSRLRGCTCHAHTCSQEHGPLPPPPPILPNSFYKGPEATLEDSVLIWGCWLLGAGCSWTITFLLPLPRKYLPETAREKTGHCTQVPGFSLPHCPTSHWRRMLSPFYLRPSHSFIPQQELHPYRVASRTWGKGTS